jgi:hypothetical protein
MVNRGNWGLKSLLFFFSGGSILMALKHNLKKLFRGRRRDLLIAETVEDLDSRISTLEEGGSSGSVTIDKATLAPIVEEIVDDLLAEAEDNQLIGDPQVTEQQEI